MQTPIPIFDNIERISEQIKTHLVYGPQLGYDFKLAIEFLKQYDGSKATFDSYRREIERFLQWAIHIHKKSIFDFRQADIEEYIHFCMNPPVEWIGTKRAPRFITRNKLRTPNPDWRPFVATVTKKEFKDGKTADTLKYKPSQKYVCEIFVVLNSFYQYIMCNEKMNYNPVGLIRQKSKFIQKQQTEKCVTKLTDIQWTYVIRSAERLASLDPIVHERTLFILSCSYLMYLRISELVASDRWTPQMRHFYQDEHKNWWFVTVGKGNKKRNIAVCEAMVNALKRYRKSRNMIPEMPTLADTSYLMHNLRGNGPITSDRPLRAIVQQCFDDGAQWLRRDGLIEEAAILDTATFHWLRHTGISDDINKRGRPVAHVRDDAGHSSTVTTDRYNNIDTLARHQSTFKKSIL